MDLNTLKKEEKVLLDEYYAKRGEKGKFIEESLLSFVCKLSVKYKIEFAVTIDRKGNLIDVCAGEGSKVNIEAHVSGNGLNGLRIIHTHPFASCKLSDMDKSALLKNNYDCLCAISVNDKGIVDGEAGFVNGDKMERVYLPNGNYINKYGLMDKIYEYDKLYKDNLESTFLTSNAKVCAVLVRVEFGKNNSDDDLDELEALADTAGITTVARISQKRIKPDPQYFLGAGKMEDLKALIQLNSANLVIFDNELNGSKANNISKFLGIKVIDRSMLILDIFAGRSRTAEGKTQVELAQLKYSLPRLSSYIQSDGRFGGGVGMRGPGETKLELNKRVVENNIIKKTKELAQLKKQRELNRMNRKKNSKISVAIVGYTNSGKSTLMNNLAKSDVYEKDELFATLDTTTRNVFLNYKNEILLTDTVGFIKNLPHEFIEAFSSTLEESVYCDILLNVVDISDQNYPEQEKVVLGVLQKLKCTSPIITVYNKIDKLPNNYELPKGDNIVCVSAKNNQGIDTLKEKIISYIKQRKNNF